MKTGLIIVGIWSGVLLFISLAIVGALGPLYDGSFYPFTLPFIVLVGICTTLSIIGLVAQRARSAVFWVVTPLHGILFLPFRFAMKRWPGGNDGPGMAWLFLLGGGSCIAGLLALVLIVIGIIIIAGKAKETEPQTRSSPLDVPSIKATVSTEEPVEIVRKERGRTRGWRRRM